MCAPPRDRKPNCPDYRHPRKWGDPRLGPAVPPASSPRGAGRDISNLDILPRLTAWDSRVPMSGCLGAHHSTAVGRGRLRSRRPTLSLAGATPAMPAALLVTFPDAGRRPDLGISPGDSVVAMTVAVPADISPRRLPRSEGHDLRATFLPVIRSVFRGRPQRRAASKGLTPTQRRPRPGHPPASRPRTDLS